MRCERCDQATRVSVRRAKTAERDGRVAVVLDVPKEECPACGEHGLAWDVAARLDELLTSMLTSDVEVATRHYDQPDDRTASEPDRTHSRSSGWRETHHSTPVETQNSLLSGSAIVIQRTGP